MSWTGYLYYMATDRRSKGHHYIDSTFVTKEPTKCIFGHEINTKRTKIIPNKDVIEPSEENTDDFASSDDM